MDLHNSLTSQSMTQTVRMVTNSQPGSMPMSHVLSGYSTIDNNQLHQPTPGLVTTFLPAQTIPSCDNNNAAVAVPVTSDGTMRPMSHLILQSPKIEQGQRDQERRIRREIANSNERRRMQSINAGFKSLKTILPHTEGEKLSKAAILQQTSEYITQLESDKLKLIHQNEKLRRAFTECKCHASKFRTIGDIFDKDEGIGSPAEEDCEDMRRVLIEVKQQLDKERRTRLLYEEQIRNLESQLYPDRIQAMKLSSSDERRSSSEYSPGLILPAKQNNNSNKLQPCARPLLPSQPQLTNKTEPNDILTLPHVSASQVTSMSILTTPTSILQQHEHPPTIDIHPPTIDVQCHQPQMSNSKFRKVSRDSDTKGLTSPPMSEHSITIFSHSTKSNQPLKKRAIEIHQSFVEASNDPVSLQPERKVAKITIDQPPDIGTRDFLPPTLPPISVDNNIQSPSILGTPPTSHPSTAAALQFHQPNSVMSTHAVSLSNHSDEILSSNVKTTSNLPHGIVEKAKSYLAGLSGLQTSRSPVSTHSDMIIPVVSHNVSMSHSSNETVKTHLVSSQIPEIREVHAPQRENHHSHPTGFPMYFAVGSQSHSNSTNIAYVQQDGVSPKLGCVQLAPSYNRSHFIVAPVSNQGPGVLVTNPMQDQVMSVPTTVLPGLQVVNQPFTNSPVLLPNIPSNSVSFQPSPSQPSLPLPMLPVLSQSITIQPTPSVLHSTNLPKFQNTLKKIPNSSREQQTTTQTLLCYGQPEITLNQLNAVPNLLAPPRGLHQPILLPVSSSLVQQIGSNSPSYGSPAMPEAVLPTRPATFLNSSVMRCRKSSLSATDSCSTASASGAEEEEIRNPLLEDPDSQSGENVPTIKLSNSKPAKEESPSKSQTTEGVAAYDEVPHNSSGTPEKISAPQGIDVSDSNSPAKQSTVSVPSVVAGSPPVIRRIDAIQTRRNLETIVQAIDHLEQQERRNSQDRCEVPNEASSTSTQKKS
ncbi:uncharacterized protein LOC120340726 [Styela clava]